MKTLRSLSMSLLLLSPAVGYAQTLTITGTSVPAGIYQWGTGSITITGTLNPGTYTLQGVGSTPTPTPTPTQESYTTNFPRTENPIFENGHWTNGRAQGVAWSDVATANGLAYG